MKYIIFYLFFAATIGFGSCNQTTNHNHESVGIQLNDGQKWVVVPEMMAYIQQIEADIYSFQGTDIKAHQELADKIATNLNLLTSNCTMKGKAHDELHKWLVPFLDLADEYEEVSDSIEAIKKLDELKISFNTFNTYFK